VNDGMDCIELVKELQTASDPRTKPTNLTVSPSVGFYCLCPPLQWMWINMNDVSHLQSINLYRVCQNAHKHGICQAKSIASSR